MTEFLMTVAILTVVSVVWHAIAALIKKTDKE